MIEKRKDARYELEATAILRVQGRTGPFLVTVLDVSASGIRLSSSMAFESGTKVTVTCLGATIAGEIRYARDVEAGKFNLGFLAEVAPTEAVSESGEIDLLRLFQRRPTRS